MAKDVFLGTIGALIGLFLVGWIGTKIDPKGEYKATWNLIIPAFVVAGSSGLIWLGTAL